MSSERSFVVAVIILWLMLHQGAMVVLLIMVILAGVFL
jgi:hypothetical protein